MDLIAHIIKEGILLLNNPSPNVENLQDAFEQIQQCLQNIKNTNTFMIMAINRCLDYTKASKGLKLVPRYETVHLIDALELPLSCMRNIIQEENNSMKIELLPMKDNNEISSCVITDKQWLQENVLCLLSNAVKYSTAGVITLGISLMDSPKEFLFSGPEMQVKGSSSIHESTESGPATEQKVVNERRRTLPGKFIERISSLGLSKIFPIESKSSSSASSSSMGHGLSLDFTRFSTPKSSAIIPIRNSISLTAPFSPSPPTKLLRFEIEDMGIGLSEEAMENLFQPFRQTQRLAGGTGLGLYSLAKRVEALRGLYGVGKRHDGRKGTLFWFAIPYCPDIDTIPLYEQDEAVTNTSHSNSHSHSKSYSKSGSHNPIPSVQPSHPRGRHPDSTSKNPPTSSLSDSKVHEEDDDDYLLRSLTVLSKDPTPEKDNSNRTTVCSSMLPLSPPHIELPPSSPDLHTARSMKLFRQTSPTNPSSPHPQQPCKLNILIVDDSPSILKMSGMLLKKQGHVTATAQNGEIALECIDNFRKSNQNKSYDVILMDLQMPIMDGLECTRRIRQREAHEKLLCENMMLTTTAMNSGEGDDLNEDDEIGKQASFLFKRKKNPMSSFFFFKDISKVSGLSIPMAIDSTPSSPSSPSKPMISHFPSHQLIIGVSANSDHDTMQEAYKAGVDAFIGKPFTIELFNNTIINLMNNNNNNTHGNNGKVASAENTYRL
jgi:CheY-like chemotaxis protein